MNTNDFSSLYEKLINKQESLSLIGLGYVGMPIAVAFAKHINVIGFDLNKKKIEAYKNGYDDKAESYKCTIDRIDVNGNYEPSNCRFVDMKIQNQNKRAKMDGGELDATD